MIKDIRLVPSTHGYDWSFGFSDVEIVTGDNQLRNAIIHAVSLRPYELETELYMMQGNKAYDYIKDNPTQHVLELISESIKTTCNEIEGIHDSRVNVEYDYDENKFNVSIILQKTDGTEVLVDGIQI